MTGAELAARYPTLYAPSRWEFAQITPEFSTVAPPEELVSNVHVVGFAGRRTCCAWRSTGAPLLGPRAAGCS